MTFDAREHLDELDDSAYPPFDFIGLDGETYYIPNVGRLTERQVERISTGDLRSVFADVAPEAMEAIADMPLAISQQLAAQWYAHGGAGAGGGQGKATPSRSRSRSSAKRTTAKR